MTYASLKIKGSGIKGVTKMLSYVSTLGPQLPHKATGYTYHLKCTTLNNNVSIHFIQFIKYNM